MDIHIPRTPFSLSFLWYWHGERKICWQFVYLSEYLKKEMHSLVTSLEERLKQNAKLHSVKLLMRVLKICLRGEDEGRERREERGGRNWEGRRGEGLRGKERGGRECKRAEANEKQLTSFPCRGKNINTVIIIRCSNVHIIFTFASRCWVGWGGGIWRMKLEGKGGRNTRRGGNVNTNSKLITLNKSIQSIWGKLETKYKIS